MNNFLFVQLKSGAVHVIALHLQVVLVPGPVLLAQVGMVDVEDEDDPRLVTLVYHLVLEAVVEDDHLSLLSGEEVLGHTESGWGVGGDGEREVDPELGVGRTQVAPGHHGELELASRTGARPDPIMKAINHHIRLRK